MMNGIDIEYNKLLGSNMGIFATKYPSVPAAQERIEEIVVPGKSGSLHIRKKCFEKTEIPIEFNYIGKEELWNEKWRQAKEWLSAINAELSLGDDANHFYRVSKVVLGTNERVSRRIGRFVATFITMDGLSYLKQGTYAMDYSEAKFNPGVFSQPIYMITGEGVCTLTVNNKTMTVNVSGDITIDTELMLAYREDGTSQNTAVKGDYEDLYLQEGDNVIIVTEGFECKVIPRWRCL